MGTINKVCAFTGHRLGKLPWRYDEADSRCVALKNVNHAALLKLSLCVQ